MEVSGQLNEGIDETLWHCVTMVGCINFVSIFVYMFERVFKLLYFVVKELEQVS